MQHDPSNSTDNCSPRSSTTHPIDGPTSSLLVHGRRFLASAAIGIAGVAMAASAAGAMPHSGAGIDPSDIVPLERGVPVGDPAGPAIPAIDVTIPKVPVLTVPGYDDGPVISIPDPTIPPFDPGVPIDPDLPIDPGGDTTTTTPDDTTTTTTPDDTTTTTEPLVTVAGETTTVPDQPGGDTPGDESAADSLAYTGSDSTLPLVGAGFVAAGGLVAGLSILARRSRLAGKA